MNEIYFLVLSLGNLMCILHPQHTSTWTSHVTCGWLQGSPGGAPHPRPRPPTVPSRDQLARALGPAPRPAQVTSQSPQAPRAGRPGPRPRVPGRLRPPRSKHPSSERNRRPPQSHGGRHSTRRPPGRWRAGGGSLKPPCVPRRQPPSARAATAARSRRRGLRPLACYSPPPASSPRLLVGAAEPAG